MGARPPRLRLADPLDHRCACPCRPVRPSLKQRRITLIMSFSALPSHLVVRLLIFAVLGLSPACAVALASSGLPDINQILEGADLPLQDVERETLNGVSMSLAQFSTRRKPAQVAARLSASGRFQRIFTFPGQILLSGMEDHWHWLAVLGSQAGGTHGQVSVMDGRAQKSSSVSHSLARKLGTLTRGMPAVRLLNHDLR